MSTLRINEGNTHLTASYPAANFDETTQFIEDKRFQGNFAHIKGELLERELQLRLNQNKSRELDFLQQYYQSNEKNSAYNRSMLWYGVAIAGTALGAMAIGLDPNQAPDSSLFLYKGTWETLEKLCDHGSKGALSVDTQQKIAEIDLLIQRIRSQMDDSSSKSQSATQSNQEMIRSMDQIISLLNNLLTQLASK